MGYTYEVAASILHDRDSVERIFAEYADLLARSGGVRSPEPAGRSAEDSEPEAFFVLTGGTEHQVLSRFASTPRAEGMAGLAAAAEGPAGSRAAVPGGRLPVLLIAHPKHNSLPASLEILARLRQEGRRGRIILVSAPDDAAAERSLAEAGKAFEVSRRMRSTRIGAVGKPSDWLAASSQDGGSVLGSWGPTVVGIPIENLFSRLEAARTHAGKAARGGAASGGIEGLIEAAESCVEPTESDLAASAGIHQALTDIVRDSGLDALTLRCFDLVVRDGSTGCLALSRLADEGIDAGCEGDIPSIVALRWARLMSGSPAWMANPAWISPEGEAGGARLLLAHCTVPASLVGSYRLRSHFESGLGAALAGTFAKGPVTLLRLGGGRLEKAWIAEGFLVESPSAEGLCRTQAVVELEAEDARELLENPLGNHLVVSPGHWAGEGRAYLEGLGVSYTKKS